MPFICFRMAKASACLFLKPHIAEKQLRQCYEDVLSNTGIAADAKNYALELKSRFDQDKMYESFVKEVNYIWDTEELDSGLSFIEEWDTEDLDNEIAAIKE